MTEKKVIRFSIVVFWMFFWGLSVVDKIIPDVQTYWVGKDFFALFIKFFASLGLKDPLFATSALAIISALEVLNFTFYLFAAVSVFRKEELRAERWFFRGIVSSVILFSLFSIGDQIFGDRFQLLEHGLFWIILIASWLVYKHIAVSEDVLIRIKRNKGLTAALILGGCFTILTAVSIFNFSHETFGNVDAPVEGKEVVEGVYKFDFPFLADKTVWEKTINAFKKKHPDLIVNYIYTGPSELNSKKKTHLLLYVFTEKRK